MYDNSFDIVDLFFIKLKTGLISNEKKKILYDLVISLNDRTDLQKERFIIVYNLKSNLEIKYNYTSLAKEQNCSCSAIRSSISRIRSALVNLKDERKEIFSKLVNE